MNDGLKSSVKIAYRAESAVKANIQNRQIVERKQFFCVGDFYFYQILRKSFFGYFLKKTAEILRSITRDVCGVFNGRVFVKMQVYITYGVKNICVLYSNRFVVYVGKP